MSDFWKREGDNSYFSKIMFICMHEAQFILKNPTLCHGSYLDILSMKNYCYVETGVETYPTLIP